LLSQLKCAHVLAKTLNFHRAAHLLGMSQPQLTRVIKALEKELGLVLFKRSSQGVTLTPDGVQALREAAVLLKAQDVFAQKMMALRNRSAEELKVAVGAFVSQSWASTAVTMLNNSHPAIAISLREFDWWKLADAALSDEFDLVVGEISDAERHTEIAIEAFPEREGSIVVRAGHELAGRNHLTLEDVAKFPLAAPRLPGRMAQVLPKGSKLGHLSEDGRHFIPVIECATPSAMIDVIAASNAVCMTLRELCAERMRAGVIVELPLHPPWLTVRQGIMYRRGRKLPAAALAFRAVAKSAERKYFRTRRQ
jgi:DNA-binding transcriptional LysR family regulator